MTTSGAAVANVLELVPQGPVRALFDASADPIWSVDAAGICHYANPATAELLGHPVTELVGSRLHALAHEPGGTASPVPIDECSACTSAGRAEAEVVLWRADGSPLTVRLRTQPVLVDGQVAGAVSKLVDSPRTQGRGDEPDSVLATTADAFVGMDPAGTISAWNAAAETLLGWSASEAIGQPLLQTIVPPDLWDTYRIGIQTLRTADDADLPTVPVAMQARHKDGRRLEVELTVGRVQRAGQWHFHSFLRDVTERRAAEESLARSEALHRLLAENSGDLISQHGPDGVIRYVSPAVLAVLGHLPEALVGCDALDLVHPDDVGALIDREGRFRADAGRGELTFRLRHQEGHWVWVEAVSSVLRDAEGVITEIHMCTRDITDRKARDAEVYRESKLESLGRLSAGLAHEINTPIQYVGDNARFLAGAFADLMSMVALYRELLDANQAMSWCERQEAMRAAEARLEVDYLQSEVPSAIEQTLQGIDRVANIVRAMKTFSHPGHAEHVPADLNEALRATVTVTRHQVNRVAELDLDLGDLPPVRCNIADLNQVFLNLIVNAADAVEETGRRGRVGVTSAIDGDQVVIRISDTGTGIPDHVRARIFDPFFTTKDVGRGTGQGLPLARAVVREAHGGTLTVRSEPGAGSTFTVRLPISGPASAAAA
ncbi:PAS domain-containing sensor histidine kinase [Modestobacter italicus]|uniref:PAS domain-containing sensor histidine kinase n=1 Tax=Modestobacter italicus (strain DSM 44449 / CECT 9708 / BC 501) TaxID=2732864 RepID=UPI001C9872C7|nr:PAS domain S-box protein [Modestobacter italicus]